MAVTQIRGNTQILAASITNAEIAAAAAIATSKLADGATFIKSDGTVAMANTLNMNSQKIGNLANAVAETDAVNLGQLNSVAAGLSYKPAVRAATTANITLSGAQTIDTVSCIANDRVLVKDQSSGLENGIYIVATGAWSRAPDCSASAEVTAGMACWVNEGSVNVDTGWVLTTNNPITLDTTALVFTQFTGLGTVTAGSCLLKTGNTLDLRISGTGGLEDSSDYLAIKLDGATLSCGSAGLKIADTFIPPSSQWKQPCKLATTTNINLSSPPSTIDGTSPGDAQRILVRAQSTASQNGIYVYYVEGPAMVRASDADSGGANGDLRAGHGVYVTQGSTLADTFWFNTNDGTITLDTTDITYSQFNPTLDKSLFVTRETPTGLVNGSNVTYTLANTPESGTESVYLNGMLQESGAGNDYTISGGTITYLTAPVSGDKIRVSYIKD